MVNRDNSSIKDLQQAIAALEAQRELLGDDVVNASIAALEKELADLEPSTTELVQQRKLATILFTDIVGHTKLVQDLDPEDNMAIIDGALVRLAEVVESHSGHIARYQGDGFKAVFGLPVADEADPANAVRAGLGIIATAQAYGRQMESEWGLAGFNVRVGIDTGLVVAGGETEAEDTIKGLVVNLSARLESAAPPGGVLISQHTYRHVRGLFDVEALEPVAAKGFPDPVPVYLVHTEKPQTFSPGTRGVEGIETRMVGRDDELRRLQDALDTAVQKQQTTVITIDGEAGVGKSRLLFEFEKWLSQQPGEISLFKARATQQTSGSAQYLWREMLAERFQILDSDSLASLQQKFSFQLEAFFEKDGEMKAHLLGSWLGYDFQASPYLESVRGEAQQLKRRATLYLAQFFSAVSAVHPVFIFLEDIHWADKGSLDTVGELVRQRPQLPLLILCLARPSHYQRLPEWGRDIGTHSRLHLEPLSDAHTSVLVSEILRLMKPLPEALLELVSRRAEGNPFYAEELIKMLVDEGSIVTSSDQWRFLPERLDALDVPPTLAGVLQARIDRLSPAEKETLQQASVIGRIFWDRTLEALPNDREFHLPSLQAKEFIFAQAESAFVEAIAYIFKHALLRDVAYESVLRRLRREYHARVGEWLEEHAQDRLDEFSAVIAGHYTQADVPEKAAHFWERAGDTAFRSGDFSGARDAFEQTLALKPERSRLQMARLYGKLAATLPILQREKEAESTYRKALAQLDGQPRAEQNEQWQVTRIDLTLGLIDTLYWQHRPDDMKILEEELEPILLAAGTLKQKADYFERLSQSAFLQTRYLLPVEKFAMVEESLAYALQSDDELLIARKRFHLGFHYIWYRRLGEAEAMIRQALQTADELSDTWLSLQCKSYLSLLFRMQSEPAKLKVVLPELLSAAAEINYPSYSALAWSGQAWLNLQKGEWVPAQTKAQEALNIWQELDYPIRWPANWILLAIALRQERLEDCMAVARSMLSPNRQQMPPDLEDILMSAVSAWQAGNGEGTESHLHASLQLASDYHFL